MRTERRTKIIYNPAQTAQHDIKGSLWSNICSFVGLKKKHVERWTEQMRRFWFAKPLD